LPIRNPAPVRKTCIRELNNLLNRLMGTTIFEPNKFCNRLKFSLFLSRINFVTGS
jgi:hypothetical protein